MGAFERYIKGDTVSYDEVTVFSGDGRSHTFKQKETIGPEEIRNRWERHGTTEDTKNQHELISDTFKLIAAIIDETVPAGRAKDESLARLQESSMWANFGIAEQVPLSD